MSAIKAREMNKLMKWIGKSEDGGDTNFEELCKAVSIRKNKENAATFASIPYNERIIMMPQCLRRIGACSATETAKGYDCGECMNCAAGAIVQEAKKLGYLGAYILKGGRAISAIIEEVKPKGALGVACDFEGALGILACEKENIPVQFVPLTRDGCSDTDVNIDDVISVMRYIDPLLESGK